jgi:hypothetical protein
MEVSKNNCRLYSVKIYELIAKKTNIKVKVKVTTAQLVAMETKLTSKKSLKTVATQSLDEFGQSTL